MAGGQGFFCENVEQLQSALEKAVAVRGVACCIIMWLFAESLNFNWDLIWNYFICFQETEKPTIINVMISTSAQRKQQDFDWLTRAKL